MQLYLDSFGAYLSVSNGCFKVGMRNAEARIFPVRRVSAILMTPGTALSADAAVLAAAEHIPLLFINPQTHYPTAMIHSGKPGSIASIRKNQLVFSRADEGLAWAAGMSARKVAAQAALLDQLSGVAALHPPPDLDKSRRMLLSLEKDLLALTPDAIRESGSREAVENRIRGLEGTASRLYFQRLADLLSGVAALPGRSGKPAFDPFNALLNYLYGMLYTSVHLAMLKSGVDPYIGVLHADRYGGAPTLVFDAIEPFRPWADEVAVQLALAGVATPEHFDPDPDDRGLWLNSKGKGRVIETMLAFMEGKTAFNERQVKRSVCIDLEMQKLAAFLKDFEE